MFLARYWWRRDRSNHTSQYNTLFGFQNGKYFNWDKHVKLELGRVSSGFYACLSQKFFYIYVIIYYFILMYSQTPISSFFLRKPWQIPVTQIKLTTFHFNENNKSLLYNKICYSYYKSIIWRWGGSQLITGVGRELEFPVSLLVLHNSGINTHPWYRYFDILQFTYIFSSVTKFDLRFNSFHGPSSMMQ